MAAGCSGRKAGRFLSRRRIQDLLKQEGPMCQRDIADLLGISTSGVSDIIKRANAASGNTFAHICSWRRNYVTSGPPSPIYKAGPGKSKPRPRAEPKSVRSQRYEEKNRAMRREAKRLLRKRPATGFGVIVQQLLDATKGNCE